MNKESEKLFSRHILLKGFGGGAQERLLSSKVCIIGCGGLGCGVLPYIIAAGVGEVVIIDQGGVELSNLQRQPLYRVDDIGVEKVDAAMSRLSGINNSTSIIPLQTFITPDNIGSIITSNFDLVIDCTDNFDVRYLLADHCWSNGIPLLSAAVLEFVGHILALINKNNNPCLRCLVSEPPVGYNKASDVGVFGPAVGVMGTLQAVEAVKMLAGIGDGLEREFLSIDFLSMRVHKMSREVDTGCKFCSKS